MKCLECDHDVTDHSSDGEGCANCRCSLSPLKMLKIARKEIKKQRRRARNYKEMWQSAEAELLKDAQ